MANVKLCILGEAWGAQEEAERCAFVGPTGYELNALLGQAGLSRQDCHVTNVFNLRPRDNKIENFCGPKSEAVEGYPVFTKGKYIHRRYTEELQRLEGELEVANPNLILALGNTAIWAMLGQTGMKSLRGTVHLSTHTMSGFKVLPTYHPAAIFRQYHLKPIVAMDFIKAAREQEFPEIRRPRRLIHIPETPEEIDDFFKRYLDEGSYVAVDIETSGRQITCIGFAVSPSMVITIPTVDSKRLGRSYWVVKDDELRVWQSIRRVLEDARIKKVFQNGLYDITFIWRTMGIRCFGAEHDTMLLHHALQPESIKDLGFLGSVYTNDVGWKKMNKKGKTTIKKDD